MSEEARGSEAQGATRKLAAFVAGLRYETIPLIVVAKAKACVLDALGCMVFGSTLPWTTLHRHKPARVPLINRGKLFKPTGPLL